VLLLISREYERLANAATVLSPASRLVSLLAGSFEAPADLMISTEELGLSEPVASRYARLLAFWYWSLTATGAHFAIGDTSAPAELLSGYRMVIVPTFEFMDRELQRRLLDYADAGGTLVVGPRAPRMDARMQPFDILASHMHKPEEVRRETEVFGVEVEEMSIFADGDSAASITYRHQVGRGWLVHLGLVPLALCSTPDGEPFAPMLDMLMRAGGIEPSFVPADSRVDVAVWRGDGTTLLFVANPTPDSVSTSISHTGGVSLADLRTGERYSGQRAFDIELEPWTIKMLGTPR
jgi:hypothetical protein